MILFALEEFAARRRKSQDDELARLLPIVTEALTALEVGDADWADVLIGEYVEMYARFYEDDTEEPLNEQAAKQALGQVKDALDHSTPDSDPKAMALMLIVSAQNMSAIAAADADPEDLVLEWVDMEDNKVRPAHRDAGGQQRPPGEPFMVGGVKMSGPGDVTAPIELWINCRCVLRPALALEFRTRTLRARMLTGDLFHPMVERFGLGHTVDRTLNHPALVAAAADYEGVTHAGLAIVALDTQAVLLAQRAYDETDDEAVRETWEFPGGGLDDGEEPEAGAFREFSEEVGYRGFPAEVVDGWRSGNGVFQGFVVHTPTEWSLHEWEPNKEVQAIRWFTREMIAENEQSLRPEVRDETDWDLIFGSTGNEDTMDEDAQPIDVPTEEAPAEEEPKALANPLTPWWGALTVEGRPSGDGRFFNPNSLTHRPMTDRHLPLSFQKLTGEGHSGSETVAMIEGIGRAPDGLIYGWGHFRQTDAADEVIGLIADFGRFGVSIDADDAEMEFDDKAEQTTFTAGRICGAAIVGIPALHEAFVALGEIPVEVLETLQPMVADEFPEDEGVEPIVPEEAEEGLVASGVLALAEKVQQFKDLAPGVTEDGPGWLTHPADTDRLRDYWVHGAGAAEVGWGVPGDFNRCRLAVAEYVKPQFINGYCANRHKDALGVWPGQEAAGSAETLSDTEMAPAVSLVASVAEVAPADWFKNPEFSGPDDPRMVQQPDGAYAAPLTVTPEGQVFGHIARWGVCHLAFGPDKCVTAPRNNSNYSQFRQGAVMLDDGRVEAVGHITVGAGHAGLRLRARAAAAHYDNSAHRAATVTCGDDDYGIWVAGWVPPGTPPENVTALMGSTVSGDWRPVGGQRELVAALAVNTGGYGIARLGVSRGEQTALVAAGMVIDTRLEESEPVALTASAIEQLADAVIARMDAKAEAKKKADQEKLERLAALQARVKEHH